LPESIGGGMKDASPASMLGAAPGETGIMRTLGMCALAGLLFAAGSGCCAMMGGQDCDKPKQRQAYGPAPVQPDDGRRSLDSRRNGNDQMLREAFGDGPSKTGRSGGPVDHFSVPPRDGAAPRGTEVFNRPTPRTASPAPAGPPVDDGFIPGSSSNR